MIPFPARIESMVSPVPKKDSIPVSNAAGILVDGWVPSTGGGSITLAPPSVTTPSQVPVNGHITLTIRKQVPTDNIKQYMVIVGTNDPVYIDYSGETTSYTIQQVEALGTVIHIDVHCVDIRTNVSPKTSVSVTVSNVVVPTPFTVLAPTDIQLNSVDNKISFYGSVTNLGTIPSYKIVDCGAFTFSKTTGIRENEIVTFTNNDTILEHTASAIKVVSYDTNGIESSIITHNCTVTDAIVCHRTYNPTNKKLEFTTEDGTVLTEPTQAFWDAHPLYSNITEYAIDGQMMIRWPAFYFRVRTLPDTNRQQWSMSNRPLPGYQLHYAFYDNTGKQVPYFYRGKYQGTISTDRKLCSLPAVTVPMDGTQTLDGYIAYANNRNVNGVTGFCVQNIYHAAVPLWYYTIRYDSFDCVTTIGAGCPSNYPETTDGPKTSTATVFGSVGEWGVQGQMFTGAMLKVNTTTNKRVLHIINPVTRELVASTKTLPNTNVSGYATTYHTNNMIENTDFTFSALFIPDDISKETGTDALIQNSASNWHTSSTTQSDNDSFNMGLAYNPAGSNQPLYFNSLFTISLYSRRVFNNGARLVKI